MAIVHDAQWFDATQGLCNEEIFDSLSNKDVTFGEIYSYFGPKVNKNGQNYEEYLEPRVVTQIKKLLQWVYNHENMTNKQLPLKLA